MGKAIRGSERMQNVVDVTVAEPIQLERGRLAVTGEFVAYLVIAGLALALYFAALGAVPMSTVESREALAAWRAVSPDASGERIVAQSPLLFLLQSIVFATLGANETTARGLTALAGVALVLSPLLFRGLFGAGRAFFFSLLLLGSPVLLISARSSGVAVWSLLLAGLALWAFWRARVTGQGSYGVVMVVAFAALILLSEPGGAVLALILAGAALLTLLTAPPRDEDDEADVPEAPENTLFLGLRNVPWTMAGLIAGLIVLLVGTGFLLYPSGLSAIGEAIGGFARGFGRGSGGQIPFMLPAVIALFYEPFTLLFALVGIVILVRGDALSAVDRFLASWAVLGVFAALVFGGARPDHALWITVPLAGLAAHTITRMMASRTEEMIFAIPTWARWGVAIAVVALMCLFTLSFQSAARSLLTTPDEIVPTVDVSTLILLILSVLFVIVGFFMVASLWDSRTALNGLGLGALIFGLLTSMGSGWNTAVAQSEDPSRLWDGEAVTFNAALLRQTLIEISDRQSRGFTYYLPVAAQAPDDGVIAWLLRDFNETRFISTPSEAATLEVALLPRSLDGDPDLGGPYVGQDFAIRRFWTTSMLRPIDIPAWWAQGQVRAGLGYTGQEDWVLWLRQDVYDGTQGDATVAG
jgi:hypothetical protein